MQNICTLSDYNYLNKGLALYESLLKTKSKFKLYYLCLDHKSFQKLTELSLEDIIPINIDTFIDSDEKLKELKKDNWYFCMSLASYFSNYLINIKGLESLLYIDSDIYFHRNINEFVNIFKEKEIAIFRHRQFKLNEERPEGLFNVGVVYFTNGKFGKKVLSWWSDAVLNKKYPHLATCGDQKYLDMFIQLMPENAIYIDGDVGHGAPWQWQLYDLSSYIEEGIILWENKKQILYFTHFSQFDFDKERLKYIPSTMHHIYTPLDYYNTNKDLKFIYDSYFSVLKEVKNKFNLN